MEVIIKCRQPILDSPELLLKMVVICFNFFVPIKVHRSIFNLLAFVNYEYFICSTNIEGITCIRNSSCNSNQNLDEIALTSFCPLEEYGLDDVCDSSLLRACVHACVACAYLLIVERTRTLVCCLY